MYLKVYLLIYYTILPHLNTLRLITVYLMDTYLIRLKQIIQPAFYIGNYLIQLLRFVYIGLHKKNIFHHITSRFCPEIGRIDCNNTSCLLHISTFKRKQAFVKSRLLIKYQANL